MGHVGPVFGELLHTSNILFQSQGLKQKKKDNMPRFNLIVEAVKMVSHKELSYLKAAEKYGISLRSLKRYCQKASTAGTPLLRLIADYLPTSKIFSCIEDHTE
ncbi:hypothetical protein AVEN_53493-1 [Araneus ventricosus]|uniref:HTH psq-type domain-containing protein n=1 Tax=Araneus ventricosus TaxID=182803 RepID=A0A4Y2ACZ8_ARAVE|nr:hypothetical protein AVEN_53493-1 [Araneus ventricosus]